MKTILVAFAAAAFTASCLDAQVVIDPGVTLLIDPREPVPLQKAARDLASDLSAVFGKPVRVAGRRPSAASPTLCVCFEHNIPATVQRPTGREVLAIHVEDASRTVVLTGSDLRGAIYAVYQFSRDFLHVDPFYWWTDHTPPRAQHIVVPAHFARTDGPPAFRFRGWFMNDEDLLSTWKPGTKDGTNIALEVWDRVYEALLRNKGNMMVPGTFIFPDEPQVRAAADRGIVISQHHIEVLGLNTYRWRDDRPYSFFSRPDLLSAAWTNAVRQYRKDQEVLWTVGYRGRHDRAFWMDDKDAGSTDAERARAIRSAIDRQMEIVRQERGDPYFLMNAWMESVPFVRAGLLQLPAGVHLVWPDNGHGVIRDEGSMAPGQGVYYHTAMYNSRANQLTEMVPLERIERELGRAAKAGATDYLLVNTSDLRPVLMTTRGVMELAWNPRPWTAAKYLEQWCREEFGERAAPAAAEYYRDYFAAPARYGPQETETAGDNFYHTVGREFLVSMIQGDAASRPKFKAEAIASATREADPVWQKAQSAAARAGKDIPAGRRDFFQAHVLTQLAIHLHSNRMLLRLAQAAATDDVTSRLSSVHAAMEEIDQVLAALNAAETGKWKGFYQGELFVNVRHSKALAGALAAKLEGSPLPANVPIAVRPEDPYVPLKAYQGSRRVE